MVLWTGIRFLHLVAMAFFVGGQLLLAAAVVPVARGRADRTTLRSIARRFGVGTLAAIAVLAASGAPMAGHFHRWGEGALQVKLVLVGAVAVLVSWHIRRPELRVLDAGIFLASLAIVWLGVTVAH